MGFGKAIDFAFWMSEGWKNLFWRWLASRYLLWNILLVLGFYNDSKYVVRCPRHDVNVFCPHPPLEYLSALKSFIELSTLGQTWCIQGTHMFCWLSAEAGAYHLSRVNLLSAKLHCANYFQRWKQTFCNDLVRTVNIDICYLPVSAEKSENIYLIFHILCKDSVPLYSKISFNETISAFSFKHQDTWCSVL